MSLYTDCEVLKEEKKPTFRLFHRSEQRRVFLIQGDSEEEVNGWVTVIRTVLEVWSVDSPFANLEESAQRPLKIWSWRD